MSVFRAEEASPDWCDLRVFDFVDVGSGGSTVVKRRFPDEVLLVTYGTGHLRLGGASLVLREPQFIVLPKDVEEVRVDGTSRPVQIVRFGGSWGPDIFGCGVFRAGLDVSCQFVGDPVTYPKATRFDSHYHDYDEYWVILEGSGSVVVGDKSYRVRPGDCIPIGAGYHHDIPLCDATIKSAYVEISMFEPRRLGHLWAHTHGAAEPRPERRPT